MSLDTRNKNIYGLGLGISTVFKIFGYFLFNERWAHPLWSLPTYQLIPLDTRNKNIYIVLGWRIQQFS
jgi:hypothetical protein